MSHLNIKFKYVSAHHIIKEIIEGSRTRVAYNPKLNAGNCSKMDPTKNHTLYSTKLLKFSYLLKHILTMFLRL